MQQETGQMTPSITPCLHRKHSGFISANVRRDRAEHARKNALVDQGIGLAIDAQGSDDYDYAVVLADLYSPTDTDLSTLREVLELARTQLRSRHECKAWANPRGKNSAEALRVRFWLQTRAYTAAEIYQELMQVIQEFVTMEETKNATLSVPVYPGDVLDVMINFGENGIVDIDFLLDESDEL